MLEQNGRTAVVELQVHHAALLQFEDESQGTQTYLTLRELAPSTHHGYDYLLHEKIMPTFEEPLCQL